MNIYSVKIHSHIIISENMKNVITEMLLMVQLNFIHSEFLAALIAYIQSNITIQNQNMNWNIFSCNKSSWKFN